MAKQLYTIGYSGFPQVNDFINVLKDYGIQIVIDVRSSPFSSYFSDYDKTVLSENLKKHDIVYRNFARQFGARQDDPSFYKNGRLDFETFAKSPQFLDGVHRVEDSKAKIVFMCSEKQPSHCHRAILVARAFSDRGYPITHIKPDGETMTQNDIEAELVEAYFPDRSQTSLFSEDNRTEEECIAEAYQRRNDEIGFKFEELAK